METKVDFVNNVTFTTCDGFSIKVSQNVATMCKIVEMMFEEEDEGEVCEESKTFPLQTITKKTMDKVLEFCKYQRSFESKDLTQRPTEEILKTPIEKPLTSDDLSKIFPKWYVDYVDVDQDFLFEITLAANFLDIKDLLDLCCAKNASNIKGLPLEEIREIFGIENDLTEEEEEQLRKDNEWIDEIKKVHDTKGRGAGW